MSAPSRTRTCRRAATVAAGMDVRPGDFGANLSNWFRLLGREWKPLLVTSLVAYVPLAVALTILYLMADVADVFARLSDPDLVNSLTFNELLDLMGPVFIAGLVAISLQLLATAFIYVAAARITARHYAGLESGWREPVRFAWGRMARTVTASLLVLGASLSSAALVAAVAWALIANLGTTFVSVFLTAVLVLTYLVILIWLSVSVSLYPQSVGLSQNGPVDSIKESFRLVQGRWWVTVGFLLVTSLMASLILQVMNFALVPLYVAGAAVPGILGMVIALTTFVQGPVVAAIAAAYAIWYIDLRARREALGADSLVV